MYVFLRTWILEDTTVHDSFNLLGTSGMLAARANWRCSFFCVLEGLVGCVRLLDQVGSCMIESIIRLANLDSSLYWLHP